MKILVYTPSDQPSVTGKEALDRHKNIMDALQEFKPSDHKYFEKKSQAEKNDAVGEWDKNGNIIIAHYSDISPNRNNLLPKMLTLQNAIGVFHCWDYPIQDGIVEKLRMKPNIVFANSEKVIKNIKQFVEEYNRRSSLKNSVLKLMGKDEEHEIFLKEFETASPLDGSQWRSKLIQSKGKLNDYLQNN